MIGRSNQWNAKGLDFTDLQKSSTSIVTNYFQNEQEVVEYLKSPEKYHVSQYDLPDFLKDFESVLKDLKENKVSPLPSLETYKPYQLLSNIKIDVKVVRRGPGLFDNVSEPFQGTRQYKAISRMTVSDPRAPGYSVLVNQLFFDNILKISVLSKNYRNADEAMYFLEDLLHEYGLVFVERGLLHLRYMERLEDKSETTGDVRTFVCSMHVYVRTFKMYLQYEKQLEQLKLNLTITQD